MTKTQALQRLYKALTNKDGRNTSTKVIEDLAVAAENGEIGGGGDYDIFHVTITEETGGTHIFMIPNIVEEEDMEALAGFYMTASTDPTNTIDVVGYEGAAFGMVSVTGVVVTGDVQKTEAGHDTFFLITGDGTITIPDK